MKLVTTDTQLDALWKAHNGTRASATTVKVDKAALYALLNDHGALVGRLGKIVPLETNP